MKKKKMQAGVQDSTMIGDFVKQSGVATLLAVLITLSILTLSSFVMTKINLPFITHQPISMAAMVLAILCAARWMAMRRQKNGLLLGMATGLILFLLLMTVSLLLGNRVFSAQLLIKLIAFVCAGGLGGMLGLSAMGKRKKKFKAQ